MIGMESILNVGGFSCRGGLFNGAKSAKHFGAPVQRNIGNVNPVSFAETNASNASGVVGSNAGVFSIFSLARLSKIAPTIVGFIAVNMINLARSITSHHSPNKAVGKKLLVVDIDSNIAARSDVGYSLPCVSAIPRFMLSFTTIVASAKHFFWALIPRKESCFFIIGKDFTKKVSGWYFMHSHFVLLNRANRLVDEGVGAPLSTHFNIKKASYGH
jgi:hypothetical protein